MFDQINPYFLSPNSNSPLFPPTCSFLKSSLRPVNTAHVFLHIGPSTAAWTPHFKMCE